MAAGNTLAFISHFQSFAIISFTVANLTSHHYIGKEVHFDGFISISVAGFTSSSLYVE